MTRTSVTHQGNGSRAIFDFAFPYIDRAHVDLSVDGRPARFSFVTKDSIQIDPAPGAGVPVLIRRLTPRQPQVDLAEGAVLAEPARRLLSRQLSYILEEIEEGTIDAGSDAAMQLWAEVLTARGAAIARQAGLEAPKAADGAARGARVRRILFAYSQSNFAGISGEFGWREAPPPNLFVWNGGAWAGNSRATTGSAFLPARDVPLRLPVAYAAEIARATPDEDWYLIIIGRGGTGVRALVGEPYDWTRATGEDPGPGHVGMNADGTQIRYSKFDRDGAARYLNTSSLGTNPFYPARIESVADPETCYVEFTSTAEPTVHGAWRSQDIQITATANWPPAQGTEIRMFQQLPRMRQVLAANVAVAFEALGLNGTSRRFDRVFLWPTESDIVYAPAYENRDFEQIFDHIGAYVTAATPVLMTLPWPHGAGIDKARDAWHAALRRIAARDPLRRRVVSLAATGRDSWDTDANAVHVVQSAKEEIGYYIRRAEAAEEQAGRTLAPVARTEGASALKAETRPAAGARSGRLRMAVAAICGALAGYAVAVMLGRGGL
ncbi:phage tail fiber protein [Paracoccus lutimaris]|uniref:Phage T7 tail fiber protein n=1 Tax=Paracoccus lutimaris TaxID=1490030 RepID=A0A368YKK5_9RHOB|nr:phage tail fiber protein [Paracoccus lutimaris]RCW80771.1 phage T7 tail fiber protein [Paracoccus lutimaris]